ncbi:MAG: glycosyltransferase family 4 protein [Chloroflexi bacterium]|nr:glycosyltransferase family 4 protein [Chloroflexota bacterium]
MQHIAYIANIRLPTEKAHGVQICKMCEAMALQGVSVSLYHPRRRQTQALAGKTGVDAFGYYNISPAFTIHTMPNYDVIRLEKRMPRRIYRGLYLIHAQLWGWAATKQARRQNPTVYFTRDISIANVLTHQGLPTVFEAHAVPKGRMQSMLAQIVKRPSFRLGIALTHYISAALEQIGAPSNQMIVEPDAIDLDDYSNLPSRAEARQLLNLPQDKKIVGYIGRFEMMGMDKGINTLIQALSHLPSEMLDNILLLCVGGPMTAVSAYKALANQLNLPESNLRFVDRVPNKDVPLWIKSLDIATIPSPNKEYFAYFVSPMKLFEYLAAGQVILGTDLPSTREILTHKKESWLVPPDDPQAMAAGIVELLQQPQLRLQLSQTALATAPNYTWAARAQRILEAVQ